MIGLDLYSRQDFNYLDPILIYISLWIDCQLEIRKIAVCFLWHSLPGHYRVTDEALLAGTTQYGPSSFLWMFSSFLKELIFYFYLFPISFERTMRFFTHTRTNNIYFLSCESNVSELCTHVCLLSELFEIKHTCKNFENNLTCGMLRNGLNHAYCSVSARLKCQF